MPSKLILVYELIILRFSAVNVKLQISVTSQAQYFIALLVLEANIFLCLQRKHLC